MGSAKTSVAIATKPVGNILTTAYGNGTVGWVTRDLDVRAMDEVVAYFNLTKESAALLNLKFMVSEPDRVDAAADDFSDFHKVEGDGSVVLEELSVDVSGVAPTYKYAHKINTQGISLLRIAAKVDDATNDPVLALNLGGEFSSWSDESPKV